MSRRLPLGTNRSPVASGLAEDEDYRAVGLLDRPYHEDATCQYCQDFNYIGTFDIPLSLLLRYTLTGCPSCRLIHQSTDPGDLENGRLTLVYVRIYLRKINSATLGLSYVFDVVDEIEAHQMCLIEGFKPGQQRRDNAGGDVFEISRDVELYTLASNPSLWSIIRAARPLTETANTPECLALIRTWLSDCEKSHIGCSAATACNLLPDRVIYVGRQANDPVLVQTHRQSGRYIALSHCWGGKVSLQLTVNNMTNFMQRMPFGDFPKTFQDAITICRALAIDYIWIDSVCIIQDSKQDWEVQGSKMDQVYANCVLTLATDAAENSHAGFLETVERSSSVSRNRKFSCQGPDGHEYELFSRPRRTEGSRGGFGYHYERRQLQKSDWIDLASHLVSRAWCWQETILPTRVLHFLPDEITWKCGTVSRCECQYEPHSSDHIHTTHTIVHSNLRDSWESIVYQYTSRRMTFSSDRLIALAGVAAKAHESSASPDVAYYAGIWSDTLPEGLLWIHFDYAPGLSSQRIEPRLAPTWSWAGITGCVEIGDLHPVDWKEDSNDPMALKILHVSCPPLGPNKYGNVDVVASRLEIDTMLFSAHIRLVSRERTFFFCRVTIGTHDSESHEVNATTRIEKTGCFYPDIDETIQALEQGGDGGLVVTLAYVSRALFIALKKLEDAAGDPVVYERVGILWLSGLTSPSGMDTKARSLGQMKILQIV